MLSFLELMHKRTPAEMAITEVFISSMRTISSLNSSRSSNHGHSHNHNRRTFCTHIGGSKGNMVRHCNHSNRSMASGRSTCSKAG